MQTISQHHLLSHRSNVTKFLRYMENHSFFAKPELLVNYLLYVICTRLQEVVEASDTGRLIETSSDAIVGMEETGDADDGLSVASSVTAASSARAEESRTKPVSSLDAVQQTGEKQSANVILFSISALLFT